MFNATDVIVSGRSSRIVIVALCYEPYVRQRVSPCSTVCLFSSTEYFNIILFMQTSAYLPLLNGGLREIIAATKVNLFGTFGGRLDLAVFVKVSCKSCAKS